MKLEIHTDFDAISKQEWNDLLSRTDFNSPFLRYGYQRIWWSHRGGGEWPKAELRIITGYENGQLVGIAPLFVGGINSGKEVHFIGSVEISDYLDFIVAPDYARSFIKNVFELIRVESEQFCEIVHLVNIPDTSPNLEVIKEIDKDSNWDIEITPAYHTPVIQLVDDWETYLAGIKKKQRHEIRRKLRRAQEAEDEVNWYIVKDLASLEKDITAFLHLMENDEEKRRFLTKEMRTQLDAIIQWAADEDLLQLSFLTVNDKKAAGYLCFDYDDRIWVYNSGFSPGFQYYSPGWILLSFLIQYAINLKKKCFDFMRGHETYKYRFGAQDTFVMRVKAEINRN